MEKRIIAIDVGTQSVRAAVATPEGRVVKIVQLQQGVRSSHNGWAEQNPYHWWELVCQATKQVLSETGVSPASIAAVSVCGQMHAPVGIDKYGTVTNEWAQLWCDKRSMEQCERLYRDFDAADLAAITANPINSAWTAMKVLWVKEHQREIYKKSQYFLVPKDFINFKLTGVVATDPSEASGTFLWDARQNDYATELADKFDLDISRFAPVFASDEVIGTLTNEAATKTGLAIDTLVVAGGGDFPVSLLGMGIVDEGICSDLTGSSNLISIYAEKPLIHPAIQNLCSVVGGWIPFTILDCGGLSMKWCKHLINSAREDEISYEKLIAMAEQIPPGSEGLLFFPYMLGERRWENTRARGSYVGITLNHTAGHFIRAVMEGVALAMAMNINLFHSLGVKIGRLYSVGGGTKNLLWNQIKADVLQRPIYLSREPEAGLCGAALLGASGAGLIGNLRETARGCIDNIRVDNDPKTTNIYQASLAEFKKLYDHFLGYWQ